MAVIKPTGQLPACFKPVFKVVPQNCRHDDLLAAVATVTGKTMSEVWAAANKLGLPKTGQFYVTDALVAKLLVQDGLISTVWKDFTNFDVIDGVAFLWVDVQGNDPELSGRVVVTHHVRGTSDYPSFRYFLDIAETDPSKQIITDLTRFSPTSFIQITGKPK
jgi:hypothetical protein